VNEVVLDRFLQRIDGGDHLGRPVSFHGKPPVEDWCAVFMDAEEDRFDLQSNLPSPGRLDHDLVCRNRVDAAFVGDRLHQ